MCLCIFLGIFVKLRVRMYYTGHLSVIDIVPFVLVVSSSQLSVKALESPIKNSSCSIKQQRLQLARYLMNINYHTWSFQESGIKAICQENVYCLPCLPTLYFICTEHAIFGPFLYVATLCNPIFQGSNKTNFVVGSN